MTTNKILVALGIMVIIVIQIVTYFFPSAPRTQSSETKTPQPKDNKSNSYFPLTDYFSRVSVKKFGQLVKTSDHFLVSCGRAFSGFHTADDLEVNENELTLPISIHAVAGGKILEASRVSGYGGLLVQSAVLNSDPYTIYYGHLDPASFTKKVGNTVSAGEVIGNLGQDCSDQTDGERKHLHFAVRMGAGVDVRGYVPSVNTLSYWVNPGELLKSLGASNPY